MIEALVRRFELSGFECHVLPGQFLIRKVCAENKVLSYSWAISQMDLQNHGRNGYLLLDADRIIAQLYEAINAGMPGDSKDC